VVNDRPATALEVVRSLAFYVAFYTGSVFHVVASVLLMGISVPLFRRMVRAWSSYHRWCCRIFLGIRVVNEGLPDRTDVLYAVKHEAFFEAIDVPRQFRLPVVFAKQELMDIPLWGAAGARFGLIPVDRAAGARTFRVMLAAARERIAEGRPLIIFPEGTRVPHGGQPPLQAGFAGLYKMLALPVIPVAVDSGPLYHRRWKRAGTIHYRFHEEIPAGLPRAEVEARVHAAINALNA